MNRSQHIAKAQRIMEGIAKFSFPDDYLAIVDAAMIAGYHYGNALLHQHGVLPDSEHANAPSKLEIAASALPAAIQPAFAAFAELEDLRTGYVRSPSVYDHRLDGSVHKLLDVMKRANAP